MRVEAGLPDHSALLCADLSWLGQPLERRETEGLQDGSSAVRALGQ